MKGCGVLSTLVSADADVAAHAVMCCISTHWLVPDFSGTLNRM